jgi:TetR/AcrR family transcriptional regulator, fatty acid biosynthesis regulator
MVLRQKPEKVEERERIRHSLLRATVTLAAHHGFAGLGLREVARGAQIAPTSFYRHFADMEELALSLVDELIGPLLARWSECARAASRADERPLEKLIDEALKTTREEPELMRFVLAERVGAVPTCRRALRDKLSAVARALPVQLVGDADEPMKGERAGSASALAAATVTLLLEVCAEWLELDDDADASARIRRRLDTQLAHLLARRSAAGG